jgi:hypothetical protein
MAGKITDYIRANRDRYSREAIRAQLIAAGHDSPAIEAAWDDVTRTTKPDPPAPRGTRRFVTGLALLLYLLGFLGVAPLAGVAPYRTTGPLALLVGLVIYGIAGYLALRLIRWAAAHLDPGFLGALVSLLALPIAFGAVVVGSWLGGLRLTR